MHTLRLFFASMALVATLVSCKPGVPDDVLSRSEMESVLYDMHLAQGLARQSGRDSTDIVLRRCELAVYSQHGIDEATFTRSLEWYTRHTDELATIYDHLSERFGDASGISSPSLATAMEGDTIDTWQGRPVVRLSSQADTHYEFTQQADTAFHEGDLVQWEFEASWHYHEGSHEATALVALHYEGDSVAVTQLPFYSSGLQRITTIVGRKRLVSIECLVYQDVPWDERPRILLLSSVRLLRIRRQPLASPEESSDQEGENAVTDESPRLGPTRRQLLRDSLLREDSLREAKPHFR